MGGLSGILKVRRAIRRLYQYETVDKVIYDYPRSYATEDVNKIIIYGGANTSAISTDGINFSSVITPEVLDYPEGIISIGTMASNGVNLWLGITSGKYLTKSVDGIIWSKGEEFTTTVSMVFTNNLFIATYGGKGRSSPDGIVWTEFDYPLPPAGFAQKEVTDIIYGNGLYVLGVRHYKSGTISTARNCIKTYTSPDLINWTLRYDSGFINYRFSLRGLEFDGVNRFVFLYTKGFQTTGESVSIVSTDSINWVKHTIPQLGRTYRYLYKNIIYGNGIFIVNTFCSGPGGRCSYLDYGLYRSSDGITWTFHLVSINYNKYNLFTFFNGLFGHFAEQSTRLYTSVDALTWTDRGIGTQSSVHATAVSSFVEDTSTGIIVATPDRVSTTVTGAYSNDGVIWNNINIPANFSVKRVATNNNGMFVACTNQLYIFSSTNGLNWTLRYSPGVPFATSEFAVFYSNLIGKWFAGKMWSDDGINWTETPINKPAYISTLSSNYAISENNATLIAVKYSRLTPTANPAYDVWRSIDGIGWSPANVSSPAGIGHGVSYLEYGNGTFILSAQYALYRSTTGSNWVEIDTSNFSDIRGAASIPYYGNGRWRIPININQAIPRNNYIESLDNGVTWRIDVTYPYNYMPYKILYSHGKWMTIGSCGQIIREV